MSAVMQTMPELDGATKREMITRIIAMVDLIKAQKWCRNMIKESGTGNMCALGLIQDVCTYNETKMSRELVAALDRAIPVDGLADLRFRYEIRFQGGRSQPFEYGGCVRGFSNATSRVATWNNTRPTEQDVVEWFERAIDMM